MIGARMLECSYSDEFSRGFDDGYKLGLKEGEKFGFRDGERSGFQEGRKSGFRDGYQAAMISRVSPMCKHAKPDGKICGLFDMPCDGYDLTCTEAEVDEDDDEDIDFSKLDFDLLQKTFEVFHRN